MDRLSSCYFCGAALDVSLSEYPVVPKDLQSADDPGPTVVLCSTCRRKLGGIIETVVEAGAMEAGGDVLAAGTDADAPPSVNAAATDDTTDPGETSDLRTPSEGKSDDANVTDPGETSDLRTPSEDKPEDADGTDPGETSDLRTPSEGVPEDSDAASTDASEETSADGPTLTKLEYNKVMRLLQNRPFPVDRGEIREVATSAYDIAPQEFDAVIEAAVERDLIAVENGQFVDPE